MSRPIAHCEPSARSRRTIQLRCCADKQGGALENGRVRRAPKPWKDRGAYTWKPGAPRRPCLSVAHEGGRCHPQRDSTMVGMARRPSSSCSRALPVEPYPWTKAGPITPASLGRDLDIISPGPGRQQTRQEG